MLAVYVLGGAFLLGLLGWFLLRNRLARRLLADAHLIEIARGLEEVKKAAVSQPIDSSASFAPLPRDPRILATSLRLLVFYTVSPIEGQYAHQLSLSVAGGYLPRIAGESLLLYLVGLLGVDYDRLDLSVSPTTVHHVEFLLDEKEQEALERRPIQPPSLARLPALRKTWSLAREAARWERIELGRTRTR
jgi:hypothetical protein